MSRVLVTGSAGHLGEALVRRLQPEFDVVGADIQASPTTTHVGSVADGNFVKRCMAGVSTVYHTATLHKPHVATHSKRDFLDTNVTGTLNLLESAVNQGVEAFIFTSTTSAFGEALRPSAKSPAVWITEAIKAPSKNIYGATKIAAEDLCYLFYRQHALPCLALRTSRFFLEADDNAQTRAAFSDPNIKANEFLHRRVDLEDVVEAHLLAANKAPSLAFQPLIISATSPFTEGDLAQLRIDAPAVLAQRVPRYQAIYRELEWTMNPTLDRVYVNDRARNVLGWQPRHDFHTVLDALEAGRDPRSAIARSVGAKGYHDQTFPDEPYPVEDK
ncbi:MAG: NAD-dependent epimerase/dehydratase family protein [Lysobacterales bacterium]